MKLNNPIAKHYSFNMLILIILFNSIIFLNIPYLRQILGFILLSLLPGLLIIQILKLNKIDGIEKFVLSVGLSISFLMFFGLLINNLSLILGYVKPLSKISLLISFNLALIILAIVGYKTNKKNKFLYFDLDLNMYEKAFLIVPILFPALSIFGIQFMNISGNNIILMFLLFLIPIYVAVVCFFNNKFSNRLYPIVIFLISVSLIILSALRSNHILGVDTHIEYYFFKTTLNNMYWQVQGQSPLDSSLIISLLPTLYQSLLDIPPEFLYKVFHSLIYSISPLLIYILSYKYIEKIYAFLVACYFIFQNNFLITSMNARANLAILFFGLAIVVIFNEKIEPIKRRILFIVFIFSLIISHYSTTYIVFIILFGTLFGLKALSKIYSFEKLIRPIPIILFFSLIFLWYSQVIETPFEQGVNYIIKIIESLNNLFVIESRENDLQVMLGKEIVQKTIPYKIEFMLTWLTFILVGIGIITLIIKYKEMSFSKLKFKKLDFLKEKFEVDYFVIAIVCSGFLIMVLMLPYASHYGITRLYPITSIILSVFFGVGGIMVSKFLKIRAYLVILLVLIPYFLSITGITYQMFGIPQAIILNSEGEKYDFWYVHDQDSSGAKWLGIYHNDKLKISADFMGKDILISQSNIPLNLSTSSIISDNKIEGYIYLRYYNTIGNKAHTIEDKLKTIDISYIKAIFLKRNKIYNNGGSEVYL